MTEEEKKMRVPHVCSAECQIEPLGHLPVDYKLTDETLDNTAAYWTKVYMGMESVRQFLMDYPEFRKPFVEAIGELITGSFAGIFYGRIQMSHDYTLPGDPDYVHIEAKLMYDPPSGWRYGFPKKYRPLPGETLEDTLRRDGYPEKEMELAQWTRFWEEPE